MKIHTCDQLSPEWWELRRGKASASNFDRIVTPKGGKPSAQAADYAAELIAEIKCLNPAYFTVLGRPVSQAMQAGIDTEPEARRWYTLETGVEVQQVGGLETDDGRFWASPDGLVGDEGGVEIKCPMLKTQIKYLVNGGLPDEYKWQVHGALLISGRKWWDFLSYAPGLAPLLVRVTPNADTFKLAECLEQFWALFQDMLKKVG